MESILGIFNRPEYLFSFLAIFRKVFNWGRHKGEKDVYLRWGLPIKVDTNEVIGWKIFHAGVFDISVTEAIFRLTCRDDIFIDVGANIGFMASAALVSGAKRIIAFEPHPIIFKRLEENINSWIENNPIVGEIIVSRREAISDKTGESHLRIPRGKFLGNHGVSTLEKISTHSIDAYDDIIVKTSTLSSVCLQYGQSIGVLKIDVEGHELSVLRGGKNMLEHHRIRDIIFENNDGFKSDVAEFLRSFGYVVFGLNQTPFGPILLEDDAQKLLLFSHANATNFLATIDPDRTRKLMSKRGFVCLRSKKIS